VVLLGAPALALRYYDDLGLRSLRPLEMQVPASDLVSTLDLMEAHGWSADARARRPRLRRVFGHSCLTHPEAGALILRHAAAGAAGTLEEPSLVPWDLDGTPVDALAPADQLARLVAMDAPSVPSPSPPTVIDAVMVLRHDRRPIDWARFLALAVRCRLVPPARALLARLEPGFGVAIPEVVMRDLREADPPAPATCRDEPTTSLQAARAFWASMPASDRGARGVSELLMLLRDLWNLDHVWTVPLEAGRRALRRPLRLRRARTGG